MTRMRSPRRAVPWLIGAGVLVAAGLGYAGVQATRAGPPTGRYVAETRWGGAADEEPQGLYRVDAEVARGWLGAYSVTYRVQMDPPGQIAGCQAPAERSADGGLEFRCNDGWNEVHGAFHASAGGAVLRIDDIVDGDGAGVGAFYGEHELHRAQADRPRTPESKP